MRFVSFVPFVWCAVGSFQFDTFQLDTGSSLDSARGRLMAMLTLLLLALSVAALGAQQPAPGIAPSFYKDLHYRLVGPFRASRTVGGVGIPTQPSVFFAGVNDGGVWKTDDYGRTWTPIFDAAPTGSVGDVGVSWSDPDILYVGTGEGLHRPDLGVGDGIFKSVDGGKTWANAGLHDVQQVGRLIVHPTNPDIVFVAGLGHPYGPNAERGVFRTTDGGRTWQKVLFVNENTGAIQVEFDPTNPDVIYAVLWDHREGPWENGSFSGPDSGLYKSSRRRIDVAADRPRAPGRRAGARANQRRHRHERPLAPVRRGCGARRTRLLPVRRCGRELDTREHGPAPRRTTCASTRRIPTSSSWGTPHPTDRMTEGRRGHR